MGKTIFELQEQLQKEQLEIQQAIFHQYASARELQLTPGPYTEDLPPSTRHGLLRQERESKAQDARAEAKEAWGDAIARYAVAARNRVLELEEALFGEAREAPLEVRLALSNMTEEQLMNTLEQALDSHDQELAILVFLASHSRDFVELRIKFFEELDPDEELEALYAELGEMPSDEELEALAAEDRVDRLVPEEPTMHELMGVNNPYPPLLG